MRIAIIAPFTPHTFAPIIGGNQMLLTDLGHGLMQRGHNVTMFARDNTFAPGVPTEAIPMPDIKLTMNGQGSSELFFAHINIFLDLFLRLQKRKADFDIIHVHTSVWSSVAYSILADSIPIVHTLHIPAIRPEVNTALHVLHQHKKKITLIAISEACARSYADFHPVDHVIYNGIDMNAIPFSEHTSLQAPLLFAGRITPSKGVEEAIIIAKHAQKRLFLAGHIEHRDYYETRLAPKIAAADGQIRYLGLLKRQDLWTVMSQSSGLLFPIQWDEPFGLTAVEAMATGTPVIAFRRGAIEEIMNHGETGFLVDPGDIEQATRYVDDLPKLSRSRCRQHVELHFPLHLMLDAYERVYEEALLLHREGQDDL